MNLFLQTIWKYIANYKAVYSKEQIHNHRKYFYICINTLKPYQSAEYIKRRFYKK